MRIADRNWLQVEEHLARDDRIVLPVGSTEQHAYLSLATDSVLAERIAVEAAEPLEVLVLPVLPFGIAPGFAAFPGTVSLRTETLVAVLSDVLETLYGQGFRGFLLVNGHGGNTGPGKAWTQGRADNAVVWRELWEGRPDEIAEEIDRDYDHASWSENFPWTRLPGVELPTERKAPVVWPEEGNPTTWREALGDGQFGGLYRRSEEDERRIWDAAVQEIRARLEVWDG